MAILPIYIYDQQVLRRRAKTIRQVDEGVIRLAEDMFETMHNANGIGLAANQVGVLQRVVVVDLSGTEEGKGTKPLILLNPEIVAEEEEIAIEEGCLSLPDLRDEVDRPEKVTVRYRDLEFSPLVREQLLRDREPLVHRVGILEADLVHRALQPLEVLAPRREVGDGVLRRPLPHRVRHAQVADLAAFRLHEHRPAGHKRVQRGPDPRLECFLRRLRQARAIVPAAFGIPAHRYVRECIRFGADK